MVKPGAKGLRVPHELKDSGLGRQWYHFVASDAEGSLLCLPILLQETVHQVEHLLHDSVLPQIVIAFAFVLCESE